MASVGWPSDGRYLVTQKRDGRFVLLMWREARVWDPVTRSPIAVTPANVTLQFGRNYDLGVYQPTQGSTPVSTTRGSSLPIQLGAEITAVTLDVAPAPAPTALTTTAGNGTATVGWELPSTAANVTGFEVVRQPGGVTSIVDAAARNFMDSGLINGTAYSYTVRTLSSDGDSAAVTAPSVTPATVPSAPTIVSTSSAKGSVTVTWKKPADNGRQILGYQLSSGTKTLDVGPAALKATLSGLPKGTTRVGIRARNEMGWSTYAYTPYVRTRRR
jgi:hypothetical protein